jgi:hypothetical protein
LNGVACIRINSFQKSVGRASLEPGGRNVCKLLLLPLGHRRVRAFEARQYEGQ